jgi:HicB family
MQLTPHIEALQNDLASVAALGDQASSEAAQRMARALEPSLRLRLLDLLTEAALEVSAQLPNGRIEARLTGTDLELVYVHEEPPAPPIPPDDPMSARITLRLPEGLKGLVEAAAALEGTSANSWLVQTIARNAHQQRSKGGRRLTGYGRS